MRIIVQTIISVCFITASPVLAAEHDWTKVDSAFGSPANVIGSVHKYSIARKDIHASLDGVSIHTGLALCGWIAFEPTGRNQMMMGDLVLTEAEVTPVIRSLLTHGVQVTGLHNHLLRANPATYYMHISGHGDPEILAQAVRDALSLTATPIGEHKFSTSGQTKLDFDTALVDEAIGHDGKINNGIYQFSIPRANQLHADGVAIPPAMGAAITINFQSTGQGLAAISGDFVADTNEVERLLKALETNGIEVTAIHNHMLNDEPRMFFVHFWAHNDAVQLAHGLRAGLDTLHLANRGK